MIKYPDFEEFIAALGARGARYLVVGAHAVAFHARPRATKDLDLYIDPVAGNAERVLAAMRDFFGGADLGYSISDLTNPDTVIQLGVPPVRIDVIMSISGIPRFEEAWEHRVHARFGGANAHYLSLDDLIAAKQAAGRPQDNHPGEQSEPPPLPLAGEVRAKRAVRLDSRILVDWNGAGIILTSCIHRRRPCARSSAP